MSRKNHITNPNITLPRQLADMSETRRMYTRGNWLSRKKYATNLGQNNHVAIL